MISSVTTMRIQSCRMGAPLHTVHAVLSKQRSKKISSLELSTFFFFFTVLELLLVEKEGIPFWGGERPFLKNHMKKS